MCRLVLVFVNFLTAQLLYLYQSLSSSSDWIGLIVLLWTMHVNIYNFIRLKGSIHNTNVQTINKQ